MSCEHISAGHIHCCERCCGFLKEFILSLVSVVPKTPFGILYMSLGQKIVNRTSTEGGWKFHYRNSSPSLFGIFVVVVVVD